MGRKRALLLTGVLTVLSVGAFGLGASAGMTGLSPPQPAVSPAGQPTPSTSASPSSSAVPEPPPIVRPQPVAIPAPVDAVPFDRAALSIDDPASLWVVVNKKRPLAPADFVPPDLVTVPVSHVWQPQLRQEASTAAVALFQAAAAEAGLRLESQSAYRSYEAQVRVYNQEIAALGLAGADAGTARPGFSEHQTGLAIDISSSPAVCSLLACFGETPHGQWLAANAWRFGFVLRYPVDKTQVTGYDYEPWHFRYLGVEAATEMHDTGVTTLEEFFGLPAAPAY